MQLGRGLKCGNPNFGASGIAMTAAGYYYASLHAWQVMVNEALRVKTLNIKSEYTVEMAHSMPAIVNMAFACELAFKSLLSEQDRDREQIHKLKELFEKLDSKYQKEIRDRAMGENNIPDVATFENNLLECNNAFVDWRYFYENRALRSHYPMLKAMVQEVLDMYGIEN